MQVRLTHVKRQRTLITIRTLVRAPFELGTNVGLKLGAPEERMINVLGWCGPDMFRQVMASLRCWNTTPAGLPAELIPPPTGLASCTMQPLRPNAAAFDDLDDADPLQDSCNLCHHWEH